MAATGLVYDAFFKLHETGEHPENPARLDAVHAGLEAAGLLEALIPIPSRAAFESDITLVHAKSYFQTVRNDIAFGAGHLSTGDTVLSDHSLEVALRAVGGVLNAVDAIVTGQVQNAFCAVRPPGHHATPTHGMGFCLFNNVAIAARYAQLRHKIGKILIVDWDVHHGNGTQEAFYSDGSVLFFSSHQHPWYPGTGMSDETGSGRGLGCTINAPLAAGAGMREILGEVETRLEHAVHRFKPELILVSAGFDSRLHDPLGRFRLEDEDFRALTVRLLQWAHDYCENRLLSVLEGGYNLETLGGAVAAHVAALQAF
jgi:acetoin utilization deacetylase AcuC-like enzyme